MSLTSKTIRRAVRHYRQWRDPIWHDGWATFDVDGELLDFKEGKGAMYWWADQLRSGRHEAGALEQFAAALGSGRVVLDVGAWIGMYTLLASRRVGPEGHVYAFEPNPASRELLEANVERNRAENVTVVPAAVADRAGEAWLHRLPVAHSPETSLQREGGDVPVPAVTLASFCSENEVSPDVIKIDVEGAESEVLTDEAAEIVRETRATIVEVHYSLLRERGVRPEEFLRRLSGWGLEVRDLGRKSRYTGWVALLPRAGAQAEPGNSAIARPDSPATE